MSDLPVEANEAVRTAREEGATALPPAVIEGSAARYWKAIRAGLLTIAPCRRRAPRKRTDQAPAREQPPPAAEDL